MSRAMVLLLLALVAAWGQPAESPPAVAPGIEPSATQPAASPGGLSIDDIMPGFTGSKHDFFGPNAPMEQRCGVCHAGPPPTTQPARWDVHAARRRRLSTAQPTVHLAASTLQCLTCHDGTIASEIIGGGSSSDYMPSVPFGNVRRDHPVGVEYPALGRTPGVFRREYHPPAKLAAEGRVKLPGGRVECVSCHEPHNAWGLPAMLVKSDRRSALCLTCHIK